MARLSIKPFNNYYHSMTRDTPVTGVSFSFWELQLEKVRKILQV